VFQPMSGKESNAGAGRKSCDGDRRRRVTPGLWVLTSDQIVTHRPYMECAYGLWIDLFSACMCMISVLVVTRPPIRTRRIDCQGGKGQYHQSRLQALSV
jgi:hypothetical protein